MNEWMNEWMEWMNEWLNERINVRLFNHVVHAFTCLFVCLFVFSIATQSVKGNKHSENQIWKSLKPLESVSVILCLEIGLFSVKPHKVLFNMLIY